MLLPKRLCIGLVLLPAAWGLRDPLEVLSSILHNRPNASKAAASAAIQSVLATSQAPSIAVSSRTLTTSQGQVAGTQTLTSTASQNSQRTSLIPTIVASNSLQSPSPTAPSATRSSSALTPSTPSVQTAASSSLLQTMPNSSTVSSPLLVSSLRLSQTISSTLSASLSATVAPTSASLSGTPSQSIFQNSQPTQPSFASGKATSPSTNTKIIIAIGTIFTFVASTTAIIFFVRRRLVRKRASALFESSLGIGNLQGEKGWRESTGARSVSESVMAGVAKPVKGKTNFLGLGMWARNRETGARNGAKPGYF